MTALEAAASGSSRSGPSAPAPARTSPRHCTVLAPCTRPRRAATSGRRCRARARGHSLSGTAGSAALVLSRQPRLPAAAGRDLLSGPVTGAAAGSLATGTAAAPARAACPPGRRRSPTASRPAPTCSPATGPTGWSWCAPARPAGGHPGQAAVYTSADGGQQWQRRGTAPGGRAPPPRWRAPPAGDDRARHHAGHRGVHRRRRDLDRGPGRAARRRVQLRGDDQPGSRASPCPPIRPARGLVHLRRRPDLAGLTDQLAPSQTKPGS